MNNTTIDMFDDIFAQTKDQIKLSELWVCNWGTFSGIHHININEEGSLITGENGSGKSTIIDALMTLLIAPGKVDFNAAASQGSNNKDRSLVSYIRGSYASNMDSEGREDLYLRKNSVISIIKAVYTHTVSKEKVILTAIFTILGTSDKLENITRTYAVLSDDYNLTDLLTAYRNGDIREMRSFLKNQPFSQVFDNFSKYSSEYRAKLRMDNVNAPALLSRALGLKKIDDLTSLIRKLVLEPSTLKNDAIDLLHQFESLNNTHDKLVELREQENILKELPRLVDSLKQSEAQTESYKKSQDNLPYYINLIATEYYTNQKEELSEKQRIKNDELTSVKNLHEEAQATVRRHIAKIEQSGGGTLNTLLEKVNEKSRLLAQVSKKQKDYLTLNTILGLPSVTDAQSFKDNINNIKNLYEETDANRNDLIESNLSYKIKIDEIVKNVFSLEKEHEQLMKRSDSNMDIEFHKLREQLSRELNIPLESLMYVAELIEVKESQSNWQGAIERALGGIRQTLLVTSERYKEITAWLNIHHTNLHVRLQVVAPVNSQEKFMSNGFLQKLNWKDHVFSDFLKNFLIKRDLKCVDTVEELNQTEYSMTEKGLIQYKFGSFEKKDKERIDDKRKWCLGFSSKQKREEIEREIIILKKEQQNLLNKRAKLDREIKEAQQKITFINNISKFDTFSEIDTISIENEIQKLNNEIEIIKSNPDLKKLQELLSTAQQESNRIYNEVVRINSEYLNITKELNSVINELNKYTAEPIPELSEELLTIYDKHINAKNLTPNQIINKGELGKVILENLTTFEKSIESLKSKIARSVISPFSEKWKDLTQDWGTGENNYYYDFLKYYETIVRDSLPGLVEQFKEEMNVQISQSIVSLWTKMTSEFEAIRNNITRINGVLHRVDFKTNSYLVIEPHEIKSPTVKDFHDKIKGVTKLLDTTDNEKKFNAINKVIQVLDNVINNSTTIDSKKLLDPRLRMEFFAKELDRTTDEVKDVLNSSSGKSGGEKESFTCTVLAASLAYVLTPQNYEAPVYASVFLDEAFSNTSDNVTRPVLKIFKALKLHVNLITPFKNIEVARENARSLILMDKDVNTNESSISEVTWEEFDRQLQAHKEEHTQDKILEESKELGIEVISE